jgi:hypothetical protein
VGRKAWIWTLAGLGLALVLTLAWLDGGSKPLEWIEYPLTAPGAAG